MRLSVCFRLPLALGLGLSGGLLAPAALPAAELELRPEVVGATPPLLGYNFAHYMAGGNARDYWRYAGVRHARIFLPSSLAEPGDDLAPHGDGVTSLETFATRRLALRADPLNPLYINWPYLLNRYATATASGNNRYRVDHAFGEMRALGVDLLIQLTASLNAFPITGDDDWAGRWELWQHYYFQAFYLAREFDVRRWSMFNEPNHPNANGITVAQWQERLRFASDAIQSAIADVNQLYGKNLEPLVYAPTTAGSTGAALNDWGVPAITQRHQRWDGSTDPLWTNLHVYSYQAYSGSASSFANAVASIRNTVAPIWNESPRLRLALTEWNVSTGANFDDIPDSMDTPLQVARLGANAIALTTAEADHLYLFKFGMSVTSSGSNYPVQKNGLHHVDNRTGSSVNRYGSATLGAESWRHFVRAAGPDGSRPRLALNLGAGADGVSGILTLDPVRDRLYAYLANTSTSDVPLDIDVSAFGLVHDTRAIIEEASSRHRGMLAHFTRVNNGRLGPFTMPARSTWLISIPRAAQQTTANGTPTLLIPASANVTVRDGAHRLAPQPPADFLEARHDVASADARAAALLKIPVPLYHPDDLEFAVLTLVVATPTPTSTPIHAHLYGLDDTSWDAATTTWSNAPNLLQNVAPGRFIRDSVLAAQGDSAHLLGAVTADATGYTERHVDVTEFVRSRLGQEAAFLLLQEPRWDNTLPDNTPGDEQPAGLRVVSLEGAEAAGLPGPQLRFVRRLDSDGDDLGDRVELSLGLNPAVADSDGDGVPDGLEVLVLGTDASDATTGGRQAWAHQLAAGDAALAAALLVPLGDLDGDGRPHLLEYALDLDPLGAEDSPDLQAERDGEFLTFTYTRRTPAADIIFTVEFSDDLTTWITGGTALSTTPTEGRATVTERAPTTAERFARLRVGLVADITP